MRTRSPLWAAAAGLPFVLSAACGGGGGGGGGPPARPNTAPRIVVPSPITGVAPTYLLVVPTTLSRSFLLSASDADGDRLTWQVSSNAAAVTAIGLNHNAPAPDSLLLLHLVTTSVPASASITVLVEDGRGGAGSIDLRIVRSGPPTLQDVQPRSAFAGLPARVTLHGNGLQQGGTVSPSVTFDSFAATDVDAIDDHRLTARTPMTSPGLTAVTVTHTFGTDSLAEFFRFRAFPPVMLPQDRRLGIASDVTSFDLARDGSHVHVAAAHGLSPVLTYQRSTDDGANWEPIVNLDGFEAPSEPVVVAEGSNATFVWIGDGSSVWFRRLPATALQIDTFNTITKTQPTLVRDDQRYHVAWVEGEAVAGTARVTFSTSPDRGLSWITPQHVAPGPSNQADPWLGAADDEVWAVFTDDRLGAAARGVYAAHSADGGATWSPAQRLSDTIAPVTRVRACTDGRYVHVAWLQQGGLRYSASFNRGRSWTTPTIVADGFTGVVGDLAIACTPERVALAFSSGTELRLARIEQVNGPLLVSRVDAEPSPSGDPHVQVTGDYVYVTWREGDATASSSRVRVAVSGDGGGTFAWRSGIGDGFAAQRLPRLLHDGARFVLAWIDERDGPPFVYTNLAMQ